MPKILNLSAVEMTDEIIHHNKVLAGKLNVNPRFVADMVRGGFKLPCIVQDAVNFIRRHPHPTRFRHTNRRPNQSHSRPSCRR